MNLIDLISILIVVGLFLYIINNFIPMDGKIKQIINVVVLIVVGLWLLQLFVGPIANIRVGR